MFQIGGAGAVGTGSLRGMPTLHRLAVSGFSIWPFDEPRLPQVVEIYPRLLTGVVNKSSASARAAYLSTVGGIFDDELNERASLSEDAFDAAVSALVMDQHLEDFQNLPAVTDRRTRLEGEIWHPS